MGEISRFILFIGPVSSIFDYTTFFVDVVSFPLLAAFPGGPVSHRLVRRIAHDPDADHPRHPHAADSLHPGAGQHRADHHNGDHHGHCGMAALFAPGEHAGLGAVAGAVLAHSLRHPDLLRRADPIGQNVAHPQKMALTFAGFYRSKSQGNARICCKTRFADLDLRIPEYTRPRAW